MTDFPFAVEGFTRTSTGQKDEILFGIAVFRFRDPVDAALMETVLEKMAETGVIDASLLEDEEDEEECAHCGHAHPGHDHAGHADTEPAEEGGPAGPVELLSVPWEIPTEEDRRTQLDGLLKIHEIAPLEAAWSFHETTTADLSRRDEDEVVTWRNGPPRSAKELPFPVQGYPEVLEEFDWEDFAITLQLGDDSVPGEEATLHIFHAFWLKTYIDELSIPEIDEETMTPEEIEELMADVDPMCFRQGSLYYEEEHRTATLWVDRFFHPGTVDEVVHHLMAVVADIAKVLPVRFASFGEADMRMKYGHMLSEGAEASVILGSNPFADVFEEKGEQAAMEYLETVKTVDTKVAMLTDVAEALDLDEEAELAVRLCKIAIDLDAPTSDPVLLLMALHAELDQVDEALSVGRHHINNARVHLKLVEICANAGRIPTMEEYLASLTGRTDVDTIGDDIIAVAWEIGETEPELAMQIYDATLKLGHVLPQLYNNAIFTAFATDDIERGIEWADQAQSAGEQNPFIYHNAACVFVKAGQLDRAAEQVMLADKHGYPHMDKIREDEDLKPIWDHPTFKAVFEKEDE
jgi:hypothetical protein